MAVVTPTERANRSRNTAAGGRLVRWRGVRDALWATLNPLVVEGAEVAVVGAGNAHTVPLLRLARRAARVDLLDLDLGASRRARLRCGPWAGGVRPIRFDVTSGNADRILAGEPAVPAGEPARGFDLVVVDLVLTQLLYPALVDAGLSPGAIDEVLLREGQPLTDAAVAAAAGMLRPGAHLVLVEDVLGWWPGHPQPASLRELFELATSDPAGARARARAANRPYGCDGRLALAACGAEVTGEAWWVWPFAPEVDYLVAATVSTVSPVEAEPARELAAN